MNYMILAFLTLTVLFILVGNQFAEGDRKPERRKYPGNTEK